MIELTIDGAKVRAEEGMTVLEAARTQGIVIPTLCHFDGLSPYGVCRVCVVEVVKGKRSSLEASCTLPASEGLVIRTGSPRVQRARKVVMELLLSTSPKSKLLQDMAANMGVTKVRFQQKDRDCILCGLCVRYCEQQMQSGGLGFVGRGVSRRVGTAFDEMPEECRNCGGCEWVCPVCEQACRADDLIDGLCGGCLNAVPVESCPICTECSQSVGAEGHRTFR